MPYYCYIVANTCGNTYNGYTNHLSRRLRQHCGVIKGGARATCGKGPWSYISVMTGESWTAVRAMQVEWTHKYPTRKRPRPREYQGPMGRIRSLESVCSFVPEPVDLYVAPLYLSVVRAMNLPATVTVHSLDELEAVAVQAVEELATVSP